MTEPQPYSDQATARAAVAQNLRQRAEAALTSSQAPTAAHLSAKDGEQVLHELQVHQVELEMQNEELRRAQAELEDSRARYFDLYDLAPVGYVTLSDSGLILEANLTAAEMLGVARGGLVNQPLTRFILAEDQDTFYQHRGQLFETGIPQAYELRLTRKAGSQFWARLEMTAAMAAAVAPICRTVLSDITALKWTEEALRRLNAELEQRVETRTAELYSANQHLVGAMRAKDEFLATMSHELRTPLAAIMSLAELLELQTYGPLTEKQRLYTQTIQQNGHHLLALVNAVLDMARVSAGRMELELAPVNVEEVCQLALRLVQPQADQKQITISMSFNPAVTRLRADGRRLRQILVNLLDNAIKFSPAGGKVGLAVWGDAQRHAVEFTVWDTGISIAAENLPRLFQDFVQVDARLAREYQGAGLGLGLVRRLVELHGGQVKAESDGLGKGSRLTVTLPWGQDDLTAASAC